MNIFLLNEDININVSEYVDAHVNKMITEHTQMLVDAVFTSDPDNYPYWNVFKPFYSKKKEKVTPHHNHPCTVWARESRENWIYLKTLTHRLYLEWIYRGDKAKNTSHKSWDLLKTVKVPNLPSKGLTPFRMAIEDKTLHSDDVFKSYRDYYNKYKQHLSVKPVQKNFQIIDVKLGWTKRQVPEWFEFNPELLKPENHTPRGRKN